MNSASGICKIFSAVSHGKEFYLLHFLKSTIHPKRIFYHPSQPSSILISLEALSQPIHFSSIASSSSSRVRSAKSDSMDAGRKTLTKKADLMPLRKKIQR